MSASAFLPAAINGGNMIYDEILFMLGEIKGELVEIRKLSERVSVLEQCQSWLKGAWAVLAAALAYMGRELYGK